MARPVLYKQQFVDRFLQGEFGNKTMTWATLQEFKASGYKGPCSIRCRKLNSPCCAMSIEHYWVERAFHMLLNVHSEQASELYIAQMCPTEKTLFQGEVERSNKHLSLFYSTIAKPMRDSLREGGRQVYGIVAERLLQHFMDTNSYEWLQHLLDSYENHIIEFSVLDKKWGTHRGYNTLFWEVRLY